MTRGKFNFLLTVLQIFVVMIGIVIKTVIDTVRSPDDIWPGQIFYWSWLVATVAIFVLIRSKYTKHFPFKAYKYNQ